MISKILISVLCAVSVNSFAAELTSNNFKITDPDLGHKIFTDALNEKDTTRLVEIYADDAVMVAPGNKVIRGKREIKKFFEEIVPIIDNITLDTVFRINYKDTVVFRSKYTVVYKTPDGKIVTESTSGIEVEQKQEDGSWLFIVDHHYGGADFAEFKELNKSK